jgi:hypothetical protein
MILFDILFASLIIYCTYDKVSTFVRVQKSLRVGGVGWARRIQGFANYEQFRKSFNHPFPLAFIMIGFQMFLFTFSVSTTGIAIVIYCAVSNSLHQYIRKHEYKFK